MYSSTAELLEQQVSCSSMLYIQRAFLKGKFKGMFLLVEDEDLQEEILKCMSITHSRVDYREKNVTIGPLNLPYFM